MRINLKQYEDKTITIYAYFQRYGSCRPTFSIENGEKIIHYDGKKTACIGFITKNLIKPLCDHAWISNVEDCKILKNLKVKKGDLIKLKIKVIKYDCKENYTFRYIEKAKKIDNFILKFYFGFLSRNYTGEQ